MAKLRIVTNLSGESTLPGNVRPPGFKPTSPRVGGPFAFEWYVTYYDADDNPVPGGSATVQWYGVELTSDGITTPTLGTAVAADSLVTQAGKSVGDGIWPWCVVTAMSAPGGAAELVVFMTASGSAAAEVDLTEVLAGIADVPSAVVAALDDGPDPLSRIKASAADAITDANLADAGTLNTVASTVSHLNDTVTGAVMTALDTGTSTLSRVKASASAAIADSWGTLVTVEGFTTGGPTELVAAPSAGQKHEVLAYFAGVSQNISASEDQFGLVDSDLNPHVPIVALGYGSVISRASMCPTHPLFSTTDDISIVAVEGFVKYEVSLTYRTVPI